MERRTHDDVRHGTATLFAALDIAGGEVTGRCYACHRHQEFVRFLELINTRYPGIELHLVLDNYRTHKHPEVRDWLAHHQRFHLHFTPTSASWMNRRALGVEQAGHGLLAEVTASVLPFIVLVLEHR